MPEGVTTGESYDFTVEVADGRGGKDRQTFSVDVQQSLGKIRGAVWEDLNNNGYRDTSLVQGDDPAIVFAIDVSGSTGGNLIDWTTADLEEVADQPMGILGMEIATAIALSEQLILQGRGDTVQIGIAPFNGGAWTLDLDPVAEGIQPFTTPLADKNNNGITDIKEALNTLGAGGGTYFTPPLEHASNLLNALPNDPNIIFLSDGFGGVDTATVDNLNNQDYNITAFGIGGRAGMGQLRLIDPEAIKLTDPQEIIDIFSGWDNRYTTEPLMENVTVYLDLNNNSQLDLGEPWQVTKPDDGQSLLGTTPFQFTFDNLEPGTYTVRQLVPNGYQETAPVSGSYVDTITVTGGETFGHLFGNHQIGEPPNQAPELITSAPTETLAVGESFVYQAIATDPDADKLLYDLPIAPSGMAVDPETGAVIWEPQEGEVGTFEVIVRVQDGRGGIDLEYFQVEVAPPNNAPLFTSVVSEEATPQLGKPFQYQATAVDADGDEITYTLVGAT
ncbi:MAG: putative Ig domain-containing protein, partial [Spirulinaceae cyanobacterium]